MTTTIVSPAQGVDVGPGVQLQVHTDLPSLEPGTHWVVGVFGLLPGPALSLGSDARTAHDTTLTLNVATQLDGTAVPQWYPVDADVVAQTEKEARVSLVDPRGLTLESTPLGVKWAPSAAGVAYVQSLTQQTQGGYLQADRSRDVATNAAVIAGLGLTSAATGLLNIPLSALVSCPPFHQLVLGEAVLLFGDGTLTRPEFGRPVNAYGFWFRFEVVPPGLSVIDGSALEYPERMAQFLVIGKDANGSEYVTDRLEFHHDQERICWGMPFPERLAYSILPGVTLRFFWLLSHVAP